MTALNQLARHILETKYYAPDESKPEDVFLRVARVCSIPDVIDKLIINGALPIDYQKHFHPWENIAERVVYRRGLSVDANAQLPLIDVAKEWTDAAKVYYDAMCDLSFMPATPTLMNSGLGGMLSSCFAIRVPDTMEGIFDVVKHVAIISQKGGGCGLDLSLLRPEGSPVGNRGGVSSGPISFLKVFNETGNQVKQGGARRAALLAGSRVDHPDILKFITCKEKEGELSNFNLSVFVTDEFLLAVEVDKNITLSHPKAKESKTIRAKEIWDVLIKHSHCVCGKTEIVTDIGVVTAESLYDKVTSGKKIRALTHTGSWQYIKQAFKTCGNAVEVRTRLNNKVIVGATHEFLAKTRSQKEWRWISAQKLTHDYYIKTATNNRSWSVNNKFKLGFLFGSLLGDGYLYMSDRRHKNVSWYLGTHEKDFINTIVSFCSDLFHVVPHRRQRGSVTELTIWGKYIVDKFEKLGASEKKEETKLVDLNINFIVGIVNGLLCADGHTKHFVYLSNSCKKIIQIMKHCLDILSINYKESVDSRIRRLPDYVSVSGKTTEYYSSGTCYILNILSPDILSEYIPQKISPKLDNVKSHANKKLRHTSKLRVMQVIPVEDRTLFDFSIENDHSYIANKFISHNCNGEPGIIFQDRLDKDDVVHGKYGKLLVNPCVSGNTWVLTSDGPRTVYELINKSCWVYVDASLHKAPQGFFKTGEAELVNISAKDGQSIELTDNHLVRRVKNKARYGYTEEWAEVKDVRIGDLLRINVHESPTWGGCGTFDEGYVLGLIFGDGCFTDSQGIIEVWAHDGCEKSIMDEAVRCVQPFPKRSDFSGFFFNPKCNKYRLKLHYLCTLGKKFGLYRNNKVVSPVIERASYNFYCGFLRGLFDTDGSVQGTQQKGISIRLSQSNIKTLQAVQRMLGRIGILSKIYKRKDAGVTILPDSKRNPKEYKTQASYELIISGTNLINYVEHIGFTHSGKANRTTTAIKSYKRKINKQIPYVTVSSVIRTGKIEPVFDVQVPGVNAFDGNGFYLHNCSELPLHNYSSCNLASINLATCILPDPVRLDTEKLCMLTRLGIRFLDNVIDINNYPLPEIERMTLRMRPIGLGTMGLHDLMLKLGTEYGSKHSLELIDDIFGLIKSTAGITSEQLGSTRGVPEDLKENNIERRNGFLLTAPPTGTISMICNQVSSGIEPVFQWEYTRNDSFGTHKMRHFILEKFGDDLPPYAKTALEISPEAHVAVQGRIQKYLDESVSKTVNLPHSATTEDVSNIFRLAYRAGCKSITVYRSGSRQSEVLVKEQTQRAIQEEVEQISKELTTARPATRDRPRVLFGATFKINTPGGKAYITVNEDPYGIRETFIHISKAGSEIATHVEAEGRLISHSLKHGIPVETLIGHLAGHKSNPIFDNGRSVKSVPDAVAYVLQQFKDNYEGFSEFLERDETYEDRPKLPKQTITPEISGELCPECGEVLYQASGCTECASCGYSKCG